MVTPVSAGSKHSTVVAAACRMIEYADEMPSLAELAAFANLSSFHFQRVFKQTTGVTPKAYAIAHRAERMREKLVKCGTITEAIYGAGFNSNGRFYEKSAEILGMTPQTYRTGGQGETIRFAVGECTLGAILVASSAIGVCCILLGDQPDALAIDLQHRFPKAELIGGDQNYEQLVAKVVGFVEAPQLGLDLPLDLRGTAFQQRVWQALREIPVGSRLSYSEVAEKMGEPKAVRAIATACAANPIAVAIPCHRVVRMNGKLAGYRWGIERKRALLEREAI
jgi:AraC family transcriptional regulator, regulatory protein of adaptative response / methylated-DNA-[protein]-cysteine methyltransferase